MTNAVVMKICTLQRFAPVIIGPAFLLRRLWASSPWLRTADRPLQANVETQCFLQTKKRISQQQGKVLEICEPMLFTAAGTQIYHIRFQHLYQVRPDYSAK